MTPSWLLFSILGPLFWAFGNVLDSALRRYFVKSDMALMWFLALSRLPLIIALALIYGVEIPSFPSVMWIIVGGFLWMFPFIWYYKALQFEEPSRVALLIQMVNIATFIFAYFLINERLNGTEFIAFFILLLAGILAAFKRTGSLWHFSKAFWLILLASALWSLSDVLFKKYEVEFSVFETAFSLYLIGGFLPTITSLITPKQRSEVFGNLKGLKSRAWFLIIISQIVSIGGTAAFAYALTLGKASLTTVIMGTQPLFAILWGLLLSKLIREVEPEDFRKENVLLKLASFALMVGGLLML